VIPLSQPGVYVRAHSISGYAVLQSLRSLRYLRTIQGIVRTVFASSIELDAKGSGGNGNPGRGEGVLRRIGVTRRGSPTISGKSHPPCQGGGVPNPPPPAL